MFHIDLGCVADPATAFRRLAAGPGAFWLDGGDEGTHFLGVAPTRRFSIDRDLRVKVSGDAGRRPAQAPLDAIETFVADATRGAAGGEAPRVVGCLAYDLAPAVEERLEARRPRPGDPAAGLPLAVLARYDAVAVVRPAGAGPWRIAVEGDDEAAAMRLAGRIGSGVPAELGAGGAAGPAALLEVPSREEYLRAVGEARECIAAGEIYQVNLAQRYVCRSAEPPAAVHLRMRAEQPVAHGCFLDAGEVALLSHSPERFLRVRGDEILTEPIKGTRPRGRGPAADEARRAELAADPKERAEHVMIVDLERNDLGRVCRTATIDVPSLLRVESYATLHHLVSTVRGRLRPGAGLADLLRATFPGGSITGAPKIRAARAIARLESAPRGFYTGAILWFRGPRDFDSTIAIRTATAHRGRLSYGVGAGIVADSDAEREFAECRLKAEPFLRAIGAAAAPDPAVAAAARRSPAR